MAHLIYNFADKIFGQDGVEYRFPKFVWLHWPKTSNDHSLMFLRNSFIHRFNNVSWHSNRHFPQYHSIRHRVLHAVTTKNIAELEDCLREGWDINAIVDHSGKYNAATLAAHLDHLEVLHFLDLRGADLNTGVGIMQNTPLMSAMMNWNVRIIDYLTERGVDPFVKDKFGFTASRKAKIKKLNTIYSMLASYETRYEQARMSQGSPATIGAITTQEWEGKLKGVNL